MGSAYFVPNEHFEHSKNSSTPDKQKNGIFHARHIIIQFILFTQFVLSTQIENNSCPFFDVICFFVCEGCQPQKQLCDKYGENCL